MILRKLLPYNRLSRQFSSSSSWEEVQVPVPWGHVAGKWWGPKDKRPILTLHGWLDNCGSFDRLIPLLIPKHSFFAIDFPGHGMSSHLPLGVTYNWIDYVITIKRIMQYFKWPKMSILGHSMGAATAFYYATIFPQHVNSLICIDSLRPIVEKDILISSSQKIYNLLKYEHLINSSKEGSIYDMQDLIKAIHEKSHKSIDFNVSKYILRRGAKESKVTPNKFYLVRDRRLKDFPLQYINLNEILQNASKVVCPILYFQCKQTIKKYETITNCQNVVDILKKNNKYFDMHIVDEKHHVHLNNPEVIKESIVTFIEKYNICS